MSVKDKILTAIEKTRLMGDWRKGCQIAGMSAGEMQEAWDDEDMKKELVNAELHLDELLMSTFHESLPVVAAKGNLQGLLVAMAKRMPERWGERHENDDDFSFSDFESSSDDDLREGTGLSNKSIL